MQRELSIGTMIGEYRIKKVLGQGGFGITYLARDENLARDVAIKEYFPKEFAHRDVGQTVVPNQDEQDRADFDWGMRHFVEEARSLTRFKHKNIVGAIRFIRQNGTAYLVMEHCDGESLEALAKASGIVPEHVLLPILRQLLDGLEEVHRARLLHLDIKPSNIIIKKDGAVVLLDFGSARQAISTHTKSIKIASAGYGAIEQESADIDAGKLGPWTDVYGLGATLYRLMTGSRPQQSTARLLQDTMPSLKSVDGSVYSAGLIEAVTAALRIRPQDRPQSTAEFRHILGRSNDISSENTQKARSIIETQNMEDSSVLWNPATIALAGLVIVVIVVLLAGSPDGPDQSSSSGERTTAESTPTTEDGMAVDLPTERADEEVLMPPVSVAKENTEAPRCPSGQGFNDFIAGTLTWDNCRGTISSGDYQLAGLWRSGQIQEGTEKYTGEFEGDRYVGKFKDNRRHGQGEYFYANGERYRGEFRLGAKHGRGTHWWPNGDRYEGGHANGLESGRGAYYFANGDRFVGNYENGKETGVGTYTFKSGAQFVGMYEDGQANGMGTYTYDDGMKFVGMYKDNKRNGAGTVYDKSGVVILSGVWVDGEFRDDVGTSGNSSPSAESRTMNLYIDVKNSTGYALRYLYVRPRGATTWGVDRLGSKTLGLNDTFRIDLPNSAGQFFEVRACDSDSDEYRVLSIDAVTRDVEFNLSHLTREKCFR